MRALAVVLALSLALPARAEPTQQECAVAPALTVGVPPAQLTLDCLQSRVAALKQESADREALRVQAAVALSACEATASITCPRPEVPIVPYLAGVGTGIVVAIVVREILVALLTR